MTPIPLLPLLPPSNPSPALSSKLFASSSPSPTLSALSEPCSSTSFSATGVACGLCSDCIRRARSSSYAMRTPPDTPPRTTIKSIPAPIPPRLRNFTFLPLLESPPPPAPRWNACLDSDVDQSSDEDDGWPSDWPGSRRSRRTPQRAMNSGPSQMNLQHATPPVSPSGSRARRLLILRPCHI